MTTPPESTGRVVVVGSANYDRTAYVTSFPEPGETRLVGDLEESVGGKGANQSIAAATLGAHVTFLTALGDDPEGRMVDERLRGAGVELRALVPSAGLRTGTALVTVDERGENTILVASGANARHDPDRTAAALDDVLSEAATGAVVVSQAEVPVATIALAADRARRRGLRFVLNLAPFADVPRDVLAVADPLVVNEGEAAALLRSLAPDAPLDVEPGAEELLEALAPHAGSVVVTLGSDGAACRVDGEPRRFVAPPPGRVVDTTGAGDAFVGALATWLADGADLPDAVAAAVRLASLTVARRGASASYAVWTESAVRGVTSRGEGTP